MEDTVARLRDFLDNAHSPYHAVAALGWMLEEAGYTLIPEQESWSLTPGGKYYLTRGGSALIAFRVPYGEPRGFMMSASHCDRPGFRVKENGTLTGTYTRLATEKYGGMIMSTWLDRPLSVAGRVMVETPEGVDSRLIDVNRDLMLIPSVAIHMNRKVNEGYSWNPAVDTLPLLGGKGDEDALMRLLEKEAGGKIMGHDLMLYIRQKASVWGLDESFISSAALDDLECVWCCTQGLLEAGQSDATALLCVFDSEEVGSNSAQGAGSTFLQDTLARICDALGLDLQQQLRRSFMVSADNAHAVHPNHPEYSDAANAPVLNGGVVLKFNAAGRYTTDGVSAAIFRKICAMAHVPVQTYYNRADLPGGSTLGNISMGHISVPTADIGLAQLAMHSACETAGVADIAYLQRAMGVYYGCCLETQAEGGYRLV